MSELFASRVIIYEIIIIVNGISTSLSNYILKILNSNWHINFDIKEPHNFTVKKKYLARLCIKATKNH